MVRNKRKAVKDKDKLKKIRKEARKRWRNKKAREKALKNAVNDDCKPAECEGRQRPAVKLPETKPEKKPGQNPTQIVVQRHVREIDPSLVVRSKKFLGCGTFGNCYLANYRDVMVTVKEFKKRKSWSLNDLRKEVRHEARMLSHLEDHRGVPLLFGVITKTEPLRLVTKFHGHKDTSPTLSSAMRKKKMEKPSWLGILKNLITALDHIHTGGILHNDLKANNLVLEKLEKEWNPVIIDFGKARFALDPKPAMSLPASEQEEYRKRYPHIASELVCGTGRQSFVSDIFSLGRIVFAVLDLLPTATSKSLKVARAAMCDEPEQCPSLKELLAAL